ncbi:MAG: HD domain-containing protein [Candidatus Pacebacteria bacterium]|nr:HD domain-containing protein [Candidatus Paceibacterota bacterium]
MLSNSQKEKLKIPENVFFCLKSLSDQGFEAFIVGGCVRDYLLSTEPSDWDITTNATPEEIQDIFNALDITNFYENNFGTVGIAFPIDPKNNGKDKEEYDIIEITTYRSESSYSDNRRPDKVEWSKTIEDDLKRRDFTINAIALSLTDGIDIKDPYNGQADLKEKLIKAVGDPQERFSEDALRMIRAIRFKTVLNGDWIIEKNTEKALKENAHLLKNISRERIRDEFIKIINSQYADEGIEDLRKHNLLKYIIPELEEGYGIKQNKHHVFDCYYHNVEALKYSTKKGFSFHIKLASLLHDIGKPATKNGTGENATFYNHEIVGAKMTKKILTRLHFSNKDVEKITNLVRYHLFYYNVDEVKEASIRRLIKNIGAENVEDLLKLRMADRVGSGCPKAEPYKLRHLKYMIEKVSKDPISVKMLKVDGSEIMEKFKLSPSPKIGWLLEILLEEVLNDPSRNTKEYLLKKLKELNELDVEELKNQFIKAKKNIEKIEESEDKKTKEKFWVK